MAVSLSARRAWIEIVYPACQGPALRGSLSARRAWIEIWPVAILLISVKSLSARRAWIEIKSSIEEVSKYVVALRKESVDRNQLGALLGVVLIQVALRKESVDRNKFISNVCPPVGSRSPQGERG